MRALLDKLQRFAVSSKRIDGRDKIGILPAAQLDELARASQDMQAMRYCYESLLSVAAATANSAYEFSESLGEMGFCLREKIALHNDKESGKLMSMMSGVQFDLQEILDSYRSHIFLTITNPSESHLNDLRTVEDMKRQCDAKRDAYEHLTAKLKGNGRLRSGKRQTFSLQQLQTARDEFNDMSSQYTFRLKSLRQGLFQTLLTQVVRHYVTQLEFFRKGLESLEAIEQHVRNVADVHHIDCSLSGLMDNLENIDNDSEDEDRTEFRELSFDCRMNDKRDDVLPTPKNLAEMGRGDHGDGSYSAPLFLEKRFGVRAEKLGQAQQPAMPQNSNSYVLPVPSAVKNPKTFKAKPSTSSTQPLNYNRSPQYIWHSSPLEQIKYWKDSGNSEFSKTSTSKGHNRNVFFTTTQLPLPRSELPTGYDNPERKRQIFSGPVVGKSSPTKLVSSAGVSPRVSPHRHSSPVIAELHELPRPPGDAPINRAKSPVLVDHSAPMALRNRDASAKNKDPSPLPTPSSVYTRSRSIPSMNPREAALRVSRPLDSPRVPFKIQEFVSPPLSPICFENRRPVTAQTGFR